MEHFLYLLFICIIISKNPGVWETKKIISLWSKNIPEPLLLSTYKIMVVKKKITIYLSIHCIRHTVWNVCPQGVAEMSSVWMKRSPQITQAARISGWLRQNWNSIEDINIGHYLITRSNKNAFTYIIREDKDLDWSLS